MIRKCDEIAKAKQKAMTLFNNLPDDIRQMLANPSERLAEINLILSKGDELSMAYIKKRKRELEEWLFKWYKEMEI